MKKQNIFIGTVVAALILLSACSNPEAKTPTLTSQIDSLNYAFGYLNGADIKAYNNVADDSINQKLSTFFAGVEKGLSAGTDINLTMVGIGTNIGNVLKQQAKTGLAGDSTLTVDIDLIKQGLINGVLGEQEGMSVEEAETYVNTTLEKRKAAAMAAKYGKNKQAGIDFLAENATKGGVKVTESGLQYKVIKQGKGAKPKATDKVKVHYHGTLIDGTVFDSSKDRGTPAEFSVNRVIPGWTEALQLMRVGSTYRLFIPTELAYGTHQQPNIPPFSTLIFDVELLGIEK